MNDLRRLGMLALAVVAASISPALSAPAIDYGPFMRGVEKRIKSHWHSPKEKNCSRVVAAFFVLPNGTISDLRLSVSSGAKAADDAALAAVRAAVPFEKPPKGSPDKLAIEFSFDKDIYAKDGSTRGIPNTLMDEISASRTDKWMLMRLLQNHAAKALESKDYDLALHKYAAMLYIEPSNAAAAKGFVASQANRTTKVRAADARKLLTSFECEAVDKALGRSAPVDKTSQPRSAAYINNEGVKALNEARFDDAIKLFEEALRVKPGYSYSRDNLAIAYNNYALKVPPPRAVQYFYKAYLIDPANRTTTHNLCQAAAVFDSPPPELQKFITKQTHLPDAARSAESRIAQGAAYELIPDWTHAAAEYDAALRLNPKSTRAKLVRDTLPARRQTREYHIALRQGTDLKKAKLYDESIGKFMTAVKISPRLAEGWSELGSTLLAKGDIPRATKAYEKAIAIDASYAEAVKGLALCKSAKDPMKK